MKRRTSIYNGRAPKDALRELYLAWGANLRDARGTGWTQKGLAGVCGLTPGAISNIEAGRRCPTDEVKLAVAGALRRPVGDIFPWPEDIPPFPQRVVVEAVA